MTNLSDLVPEFRVIADSLSVQWPGIEAEDIAQHMSLKATEEWDQLHELDRKVILSYAKQQGTNFCKLERHYYQVQTSEWIYTPREVRHLLAAMFTEPLHVDTPKRPSKGKEYLTADGVSVVLMDIRKAFESVSERDQAAIISVFHDGESLHSSTLKRRLDRAVDNVTDRLNWHMHSIAHDRYMHDGPGSRTVMSNAAARYSTGENY